MQNIGIDIGNYYVKLDNGINFNSTVKNGHMRINNDDIKVTYNNIDYTIGANNGTRIIGANRYFKLNYKVLLLTAIAKRFDKNKKMLNVNVVIGVPISIFNDKSSVENIEKELKKWKNEKITVNGVEKTITINKIKVFCESAVVFSDRKAYLNKRVLVVDIGGSTVDISLWENLRNTKQVTLKKGTISLCEEIAGLISDNENILYNSELVPGIIDPLKANINQKIINVDYIESVINSYIDWLNSILYQGFEPESVDEIIFIGGGSQLLKKYLNEEFTTAIIPKDSQFLNTKTYKEVANTIWQQLN